MTKLKRVLLVDDDEATNYIHRLYLERSGQIERIDVAYDGAEALAYLERDEDGAPPAPEIIFLDINMPRMNGFEFLERYADLPPERKSRQLVVMLTTSMLEDDRARASSNPDVAEFIYKPIAEADIDRIVAEYRAAFPVESC